MRVGGAGLTFLVTLLCAGAAGCGDDTAGTVDAKPGELILPLPPVLSVPARTSVVPLGNVRDEPLFAVQVEPETMGPHPAVIVFHGSGGLYRLPAADDPGTCSPQLESQFVRWAERLVSLGFVVLMPDSFTPRGFCDDNDDPRRAQAFPPIGADPDGKTRRLLARIYDADAALRYLVTLPSVNTGAIALLGFSNGASTSAIYTHHRLSDALVELATSADGQALGVAIPALPGPVPALRQSIAYYPGCGFDGILPFGTAPSDVGEFFYPSAPLQIEHGALDALVNHCSITQTGTREQQADSYASLMGVPDHYSIVVHAGASHGFDAAGCETAPDGAAPDTIACRDSLRDTLDLLEPLRTP